MFTVLKTDEFADWLSGLRDRRAQARIVQRIDRLEDGHLGDARFFDGIGELRVHYGPGYRVYFVRRGTVLFLLLCGGDKSTQARDIQRAIVMAREA